MAFTDLDDVRSLYLVQNAFCARSALIVHILEGPLSVWDVYIVWLSRLSEQCSVPSACSVSRGSAKCLKCLGRRGCENNVKGVLESLVRLHFT